MSSYQQSVPQQNQHMPFFFGQNANQQYMPTMILPPSHPAASNSALPMPDMDTLASSGHARGDGHSLNMNQIDMMDDGVMAIHQDVPSNSGILGSIPEENISHRRTYDYTSELRNNYSTVTQNGESVTYVRFRHNSCSVWTYSLMDKQDVKIRIALQENQLFFNLEDILTGVCGLELPTQKILAATRNLAFVGVVIGGEWKWSEKVYAEQYDDLAFGKEEVFVTYEGLQRLSTSRLNSGNVRTNDRGDS